MQIPVWFLKLLIASQLAIAVAIGWVYHDITSAALIFLACGVELFLLERRLRSPARTTPASGRTISISPERVYTIWAVVAIGLAIVGALVWNATK